ncbi:MAG: YggS family pyridoxal phosphate-dependent enzyme [Candidatus Omnitrophota bacterium]
MIAENVRQLLQELPREVQLVAAAKSRSVAEIEQAISAGILIVGENYVQEAELAHGLIGAKVKWHFIGRLQKNKAKKAVKIFDLIETLDSLALAEELEKAAGAQNKVMPALIEINCAGEVQKGGVTPQEAEGLIKAIALLKHIKVMGLMTMGPLSATPEQYRPYFRETKKLFDALKRQGLTNVEMRFLSMGMSDSYRVAIEEGANIVRIGSKIFGPRESNN